MSFPEYLNAVCELRTMLADDKTDLFGTGLYFRPGQLQITLFDCTGLFLNNLFINVSLHQKQN